MSRPIDLLIGKIEELHSDRNAGWEAFFKSEYRMDELVDEIVRLKAEIRRLKNGRKIKR